MPEDAEQRMVRKGEVAFQGATLKADYATTAAEF